MLVSLNVCAQPSTTGTLGAPAQPAAPASPSAWRGTGILGESAQPAASPSPSAWRALFRRALDARQAGRIQEAIDALEQAGASACTPHDRLLANAELGASLVQARRPGEAEPLLRAAYAGLEGEDKGRLAIDLGNLMLAAKDPAAARRYYEQAILLAPRRPEIVLGARLNLARLVSGENQAARLRGLLPQIRAIDDGGVRARYLLNLGRQAGTQDGGNGGNGEQLRLAFEAYSEACQAADGLPVPRLMTEAQDALAQLYEDQGHADDALTLNGAALERAAAAPLGMVQDLLVRLEWRQSRLLRALGRGDAALAAMQRAAGHVEAIRPDLPIEMDDGRSSFESLLRPIYVGLAALLLQRGPGAPAAGETAAVLAAIDALELSRQAEMQDYLGERCSILSAGGPEASLPPGVAVLYPLVLGERLELLVRSRDGATRHAVKIDEKAVRKLADAIGAGLRDDISQAYLAPAQQLYDLLLRPLQADLDAAGIDTLIVASEGFLRRVPLAALHDGRGFLIEHYAVATVTGMSMTDQRVPDHSAPSALLAGLAEPGPVVDKIYAAGSAAQEAGARAAGPTSRGLHLRSMPTRELAPERRAGPDARRAAFVDALRLPGVETELDALSRTLGGVRLLNAQFTVADFKQRAATGNYRILHSAANGFLGANANASYLLAHDDVITMNGLQALLMTNHLRQSPLEVLTLSACETAEGSERAPLGFAGAATKARAQSALGTLWPVADQAASQVMDRFYQGLIRARGKAKALRDAQIALLRDPNMAHPFFWAPFTLVGNWK